LDRHEDRLSRKRSAEVHWVQVEIAERVDPLLACKWLQQLTVKQHWINGL